MHGSEGIIKLLYIIILSESFHFDYTMLVVIFWKQISIHVHSIIHLLQQLLPH